MQNITTWKRNFIIGNLSFLILNFSQNPVKAQQKYVANYICNGDFPNGPAEIRGTLQWTDFGSLGSTERFKGDMKQGGETFLVETSGTRGHIGDFPVSLLFGGSTLDIWTPGSNPLKPPRKLGTFSCTRQFIR